jgi:hypothetical protein
LTTQLGGYVRVSASRPIFAFQLFGSRTSLSFLANVAAQGAQLQPQASGRVVSAAAGANVISADGNASIAIPPGALASDTAVSLNNVTVTLPSPFSTQQVVAAVDAQPSGTTFKIPVRVTFSLSAQLTPGTLMPVLIFTTQGYQDSGFIAIVDESGRTASAEVTHFTTFALGLNTDQLINVTSISPSSGLAGATVTIGDSGFGANASDNIVTFAGAENTSIIAAVTAATSTLLTLRVPTGAITGNVSGNKDLDWNQIRDSRRPAEAFVEIHFARKPPGRNNGGRNKGDGYRFPECVNHSNRWNAGRDHIR